MFRTVKTVFLLCLITNLRGNQNLKIVHSWISLDFDWPDGITRESAIESGFFIVEKTIPENIAVYNGDVFLSVQRGNIGVPYTLNKVVRRKGKPVLMPFPDASSQTEGNCNDIQDVVSMKVDPRKKQIWALDRGRFNSGKCPSKVLIFDLTTRQEVSRYVFPVSVAPETGGVNDMTLDVDNGEVRFAYISDFFDNRLIVYDYKTSNSWFFKHPSMEGDGTSASETLTINGETFTFPPFGINGLTTSPGFGYLYYTALRAFTTWQIPTSVIQDPNGQTEFNINVRNVGERPSQASGLTAGTKSIFYPVLSNNQIVKWDKDNDIACQGPEHKVFLRTNVCIAQDDEFIVYADGFDVDNGFLWYLADKIYQTQLGGLDFSKRPSRKNPNFVVGKVWVGERNYLDGCHE